MSRTFSTGAAELDGRGPEDPVVGVSLLVDGSVTLIGPIPARCGSNAATWAAALSCISWLSAPMVFLDWFSEAVDEKRSRS